jgi:Zn-dependent M16 (insulinase) family peptidase
MKLNDKLHGFKVLREVKVPDVSGTLYELLHEGSAATLYYLDRADENKTFAIGFRTLPSERNLFIFAFGNLHPFFGSGSRL